MGMVSTKEPFQKLVNQGLILGPDGQKMSKSKGNVVNPDEIVKEFGADSLRLYEMFMGPLEDAKPWQPEGIIGLYRFLGRVWKLASQKLKVKSQKPDNFVDSDAFAALNRLLHKTIKKVGADIENFRFNTAISALMILFNELEKQKDCLSLANYQLFLKLLFPFAPHLAQELWRGLGSESLLDNEKWPVYDELLAQDSEIELLIQVNGKLRDKVVVKKGVSQKEAEKIMAAQAKIKEILGDKKIKRIIFVPDRLINIVV